MDKDIRLLGDIVKYKLADWNIPVRTYLLLEGLTLLVLSGKISFYLDFAQSEVSLQPLIVALLGAIYGYQAGLRAVVAYIFLFGLGFSWIEGAGWQYLSHPGQVGYFIGLFPCTLIASSLATFHWDRKWLTASIMLFAALMPIPMLQGIITNLWKSSFNLLGAISWGVASVMLQVLVGTLTLTLLWRWAEAYLSE